VSQGHCGDQGCFGGGECGGELLEDPGDPGEETAIEVNHTYEPLQCLAVIGFREIQNDLNMVLEGSLVGGGDAVSQEEFGDGKRALLQVEGQPDGGEDGEKRLELLPVVLLYTPSSSKKGKP
jgi:hypothetical protein